MHDVTDTPVNVENTPVATPVKDESTPVDERILLLCATPKGILDIAEYLGYKEKKTVRKYLKPLLEGGRLAMTIPEKPNSKNQKYVSIKQ